MQISATLPDRLCLAVSAVVAFLLAACPGAADSADRKLCDATGRAGIAAEQVDTNAAGLLASDGDYALLTGVIGEIDDLCIEHDLV